ncbi:AAA family ATPase [Spirosoma fluminis]
MITPEEFPYIKSLYVNNCYSYREFNIQLQEYKPFGHLILTGKNGSGKSTILKSIHKQFFPIKSTNFPELLVGSKTVDSRTVKVRETTVSSGYSISNVIISFSISHEISKENGQFKAMSLDEVFESYRDKVYSYFEAKRGYVKQIVEGPSKESDFVNSLNSADSTNYFIAKFKQYLVNKKIDQAFAQIEQQEEKVANIQLFFETLRVRLSQIFGQEVSLIEFNREGYEFYLHLADRRKITFDVLPEGISALLSILMDLFMRVDLIRKKVGNNLYNPCGIVLIDEPETHLHLQLQEQVLPLLTDLFPNIQFIAATHSPAVIASIKNATIFDLTTKESRGSEETVGRSYSELMRGHFGLKNEYSSIADDLFKKVDQILKENKGQPKLLKDKLEQFFTENEVYFSPSFRVELESIFLENA